MQTSITNHYKTLEIQPTATQSDIKQAYRRLAKLFHPDSQRETANHERIIQINAAYEVLSDPQRRQSYDQHLNTTSSYSTPTATTTSTTQTRRRRKTAQAVDAQLEEWLNQVYKPVNRNLDNILKPFKTEVDKLSADPFDDQLMEDFQIYIETCRNLLSQAQNRFRSVPNPANVAGVAAHLYYCLNHVSDGLEELEFFTLNYDDSCLHTGHELFRRASGLRREVQHEMKKMI
ncbi:J domain-containing protein [Limnoraphis robusta]|uniref:J domain-containing protein n=1 Tax=Limnoraphis robusta TaxID=1118279 RepID=UPI002B2137D0|nr:DnaJ domain-containing protein [Limnoraphis robusta]MEA5498634.1 DnaJ domain-containing protein [Limnoraphis robusta BA-68 BA1]